MVSDRWCAKAFCSFGSARVVALFNCELIPIHAMKIGTRTVLDQFVNPRGSEATQVRGIEMLRLLAEAQSG